MFRKSQTSNDAASKNAIVTSNTNDQKRKISLAAFASSVPRFSRVTLIVIGGVLFVLVAPMLFFLYLRLSDHSSNYIDTVVCSKKVIQDASQQIDANNLTNLATITKNIKQLKHHELDANCQYILVRTAMAIGDVTDARAQLTLLKKDYQGAYSYSTAFTTRTFTPSELEGLINDLAHSQRLQAQSTQTTQKVMSTNDATADQLAPGAKR